MKPNLSSQARWKLIWTAAAATVVAVTFAVYTAAIQPALAHRAQRQQLNAELAQRKSKSAALAGELADVGKQLKAVNQSLAHARLRLQPASLVNDRLERLADLANDCGLSIDQVHPGDVTDTAHFEIVSIKLGGTGSFPACGKFLHQLHDVFPDTGVRALEVTNQSPSPVKPMLKFDLELTWYAAPAATVAKTE